MRTRLFALLLAFALALGPECWTERPAHASEDSGVQKYEWLLLKRLDVALGSAGTGARVYFKSNSCSRPNEALEFPQTPTQPTPPGAGGVQAVRSMFRGNAAVDVVGGGESGLTRIFLGLKSDALLRTRISEIKFDTSAQYTPTLAINRIINTTEFQSTMRKNEYDAAFETFESLVTPPVQGLPHLPQSMKNVTVDEALDRVAATWNAVVIYGDCPRHKKFDIGIYVFNRPK